MGHCVGGLKFVDRERVLSFDLPGLELEVDVTEVEGWIWRLGQTQRGGFRSLDPERETESYTGKCKKWCFTRQGSEK